MKIGVFGGRFDPVHTGHLIVAQDVSERLGIDNMLFLPSFNPPHKGTQANYQHRVKMLELAMPSDGSMGVSTLEQELGMEKSYTVDVLRALRDSVSDAEIFFMIGTDEFANLPKWHKPDQLFQLATVVVLARAIKTPITHALAQHAVFVPNRVVEVSSSEIRERVRRGMSIRYLVPEPVRNYIMRENLYR